MSEFVAEVPWELWGPAGLLAVLCLWGMIWPRSQWELLWVHSYRYRHVPHSEVEAYVRRLLIVPSIICVVAVVIFVLIR